MSENWSNFVRCETQVCQVQFFLLLPHSDRVNVRLLDSSCILATMCSIVKKYLKVVPKVSANGRHTPLHASCNVWLVHAQPTCCTLEPCAKFVVPQNWCCARSLISFWIQSRTSSRTNAKCRCTLCKHEYSKSKRMQQSGQFGRWCYGFGGPLF